MQILVCWLPTSTSCMIQFTILTTPMTHNQRENNTCCLETNLNTVSFYITNSNNNNKDLV